MTGSAYKTMKEWVEVSCLNRLELRIRDHRTIEFYQDILGLQMSSQSQGRFSPKSCALKFILEETAPPWRAGQEQGYWKIGLTLPDLDLAVQKLRSRGVNVSEAKQFEDIGYLCHLQDPEGLTVELLAHRFHGRKAPNQHTDSPLGQEVVLGQVTLRISDPERSLAFYTQQLGLRLLSVQKVAKYGFTLYFLADTQESPPDEDLHSLGNREWLWQRPYSTLELQHRWGQAVYPADTGAVGFRCLVLDPQGEDALDPDGHKLRC